MKKYLFKSILLIGIITYLSSLNLTSQAAPILETDIKQIDNESDNQIKQKELKELRKELRNEGVSKEDTEKLMKKLENGETWDSMNPKYQNIEPQIKSKNYSKTIYPDGSYSIVSVEEVPDILENNSSVISPMAIYRMTGLKVSKNTGLVNMSFKADYRRNTSTGNAIITSQYGYSVIIAGGTYTEDTKGYFTDWRNPTNAWYAINVTGYNGSFSLRAYIKLYVNGNGYWVESNY